MLDFHTYVERHGESAVQAIIERLERNEGVRLDVHMPLAQRWEMLMQMTEQKQQAA